MDLPVCPELKHKIISKPTGVNIVPLAATSCEGIPTFVSMESDATIIGTNVSMTVSSTSPSLTLKFNDNPDISIVVNISTLTQYDASSAIIGTAQTLPVFTVAADQTCQIGTIQINNG